MAWRFERWRTWEEVWSDARQSTWRELLAADPHAHTLHRPELVRAWQETRGQAVGARPAFLLATHGSGTKALLPWVVVPHRGSRVTRRVLEPAGQSLFGYHDPIVAGPPLGPADFADLWEEARRELASACDQSLFRFVHPRYGQGLRSEPCPDLSPVLDLSGAADFEALLARCSANHRGDVRRRLRRLAEQGELTLWVPGADEAGEALTDLWERFIPFCRSAWDVHGDANLLRSPGMEDFLSRLVAEGLAGGWAHYSALCVGGQPIAWHLGLAGPRELYWWFPVYDPAWEAFSPGKALLAKILEHGIGQGWRRVHLLTGGQPYKMVWKPDLPELRTVRWHSPSLRGKLISLYDRR